MRVRDISHAVMPRVNQGANTGLCTTIALGYRKLFPKAKYLPESISCKKENRKFAQLKKATKM